jgi:hypothetical protein
VPFSHEKEFDHENETVCSAGGVAVLSFGPGGYGRGVLQVSEMLSRKLLHPMLRKRRELLPGTLLRTEVSREAGSQRLTAPRKRRPVFLSAGRRFSAMMIRWPLSPAPWSLFSAPYTLSSC